MSNFDSKVDILVSIRVANLLLTSVDFSGDAAVLSGMSIDRPVSGDAHLSSIYSIVFSI